MPACGCATELSPERPLAEVCLELHDSYGVGPGISGSNIQEQVG